jgi:hypothetical protein
MSATLALVVPAAQRELLRQALADAVCYPTGFHEAVRSECLFVVRGDAKVELGPRWSRASAAGPELPGAGG